MTRQGQGLEVIGVHTPEYAFEKDAGNVASGAADFAVDAPDTTPNSTLTPETYFSVGKTTKYGGGGLYDQGSAHSTSPPISRTTALRFAAGGHLTTREPPPTPTGPPSR